MKQLETGSFMTTPAPITLPDAVKIATWNINRGLRLNEVIEFLAGAAVDLILLQEVDLNARRTYCRNVAREIAQALAMNYVFGCEFEELSQRHNGTPAYHGQATLSRFPLFNSRILRFHRQSRFWLPRWFVPPTGPFQRRVGGRMVLISYVALPERKLVVYNVHLESRGDEGLRYSQFRQLLDDASQLSEDIQVVLAGDFNTDLRQKPFVQDIDKARLSNPFDCFSSIPTTIPSRFNPSRTIDWIMTKGPLVASEPKLHDSILASDHYPLSFTLSGKSHDTRRGRQDR